MMYMKYPTNSIKITHLMGYKGGIKSTQLYNAYLTISIITCLAMTDIKKHEGLYCIVKRVKNISIVIRL